MIKTGIENYEWRDSYYRSEWVYINTLPRLLTYRSYYFSLCHFVWFGENHCEDDTAEKQKVMYAAIYHLKHYNNNFMTNALLTR